MESRPAKRIRLDPTARPGGTASNTSTNIKSKKMTSIKNLNSNKRFGNAKQIRAALSSASSGDGGANAESVISVLTTVKTQLSVFQEGEVIPPSDPRLLLVVDWLTEDSGLRDIFDIWQRHPSPNTLTPAILTLLAHTLTLLNAHSPNHVHAGALLKNIYTPGCFARRITPALSASGGGGGGGGTATTAETILSAMKLMNAISNFASGREKKTLMEMINWDVKTIHKLLTMRRRASHSPSSNPLQKPDIRQSTLILILSFISPLTQRPIKSTFLEAHKDVFLAIFKGMLSDEYAVLSRVLTAVWEGVLCDEKVKRTVKVGLFGESTIGHLLKLYTRSSSESPLQDGDDDAPEQAQEQELIPADLVHHFLLALCTRPGSSSGISFRDQAWYPRSTPSSSTGTLGLDEDGAPSLDDETSSTTGKGKIYNKILSNVLKSLKPAEDARQAELALKIMHACPELVAGFWTSASGLTMEPRLSSRWIANVAFVGRVVVLPVPTYCFALPTTSSIASGGTMNLNPIPPPLFSILASILPSTLTKAYLTKGLQHPSPLVQHCTAIVLVKALGKYGQVLEEMRKVSAALDDDDDAGLRGVEFARDGDEDGRTQGNGLWSRRIEEVEREMRKRVPEFSVLVEMAQTYSSSSLNTSISVPGSAPDPQQTIKKKNKAQRTLLSEISQRLLWLYHRSLPALVKEAAKFDVGKLVAGVMPQLTGGDAMTGSEHRMDVLRALHVLRLLGESEAFVWSVKPPNSQHTYIHTLLTTLCLTSHPAIRAVVRELVEKLMRRERVMFEHDFGEVGIWVEAFPSSHMAYVSDATPDDTGVDGARTEEDEEIRGTITFLEECIQRCSKTPYRYFEDMKTLLVSSSTPNSPSKFSTSYPSPTLRHPGNAVSPLLMTILEQLQAKIRNDTLAEETCLGVVRFLRRLSLGLAGKLCAQLGEDVEGMDVDETDQDQPKDHQRSGLALLRTVLRRAETMLADSTCYGGVQRVRREMRLFRKSLDSLEGSLAASQEPEVEMDLGVHEHGDGASALTSVGSILAWLRALPSSHFSASHTKRLLHTVYNLHPPSLATALEFMEPSSGVQVVSIIRNLISSSSSNEGTSCNIKFEMLYVLASDEDIRDEHCRQLLTDIALATSSSSSSSSTPSTSGALAGATSSLLTAVEQALCLIRHRLQLSPKTKADREVLRGIVGLIGSILNKAKGLLPGNDFVLLKADVFGSAGTGMASLKGLLLKREIDDDVTQVIKEAILPVLDPTIDEDQELVAHISGTWLDIVKKAVAQQQSIPDAAQLWIKFLGQSSLLELLDLFHSRFSPSQAPLVETVLHTLNIRLLSPTSIENGLDLALSQRLDALFRLRNLCPNSVQVLDEVISAAVDASVPIGLDGHLPLPPASNLLNVSDLMLRAERKWSRLGLCTSQINSKITEQGRAKTMLADSPWTGAKVKTITSLIYMGLIRNEDVVAWVDSRSWKEQDPMFVGRVVKAWCDTLEQDHIGEDAIGFEDVATFLLDELLQSDGSSRKQSRTTCGEAIVSLVSTFESAKHIPGFLRSFTAKITTCPPSDLTLAVLVTVNRIRFHTNAAGHQDLLSALAGVALQWAVERLSFSAEEESTSGTAMMRELITLLSKVDAKSHQVDTLLSAAIQHGIMDPIAMELCAAALREVQLKPLLVNRHLQSVVQHPSFRKACSVAQPGPRAAIIHLLYTLFNLHPWNTCQPSHIQPLISIYHGSLSSSDRKILAVFKLFEVQRKISVAALFKSWCASPGQSSTSVLDALRGLDSVRIFRSCLAFPAWRRLDVDVEPREDDAADAQLLDPVFCLLIFIQMLAESPPESAFEWVDLFRTNVVSLVIRSASSKDDRIRELAVTGLGGLWGCLKDADMQEKPHVLHILELFKDTLASEEDSSSPSRLSTYTTLLICHALRAIFYPSNFIYPLTSRFLLQRPEFDTKDVPMLFAMLHSSADEWKKERVWMLRFLADGMESTEDWKVMKRRYTWDMLASLYAGLGNDCAARKGILQVLIKITANEQATVTLVLKHSLLAWIEMQLTARVSAEEAMLWLSALENVLLAAAQSAKLNTFKEAKWPSTLCRCLSLLLSRDEAVTQHIFSRVPSIVLRLVSLPGPLPLGIPALINRSITALDKFERKIGVFEFKMSPGIMMYQAQQPASHHFDASAFNNNRHDLLKTWGKCMEQLWQATMMGLAVGDKELWRRITSRLVVWRSLSGWHTGSTDVVEWNRREVIRNLNTR